MQHSFYIHKDNYLKLKEFIKERLPSVRFLHNPIEIGEKLNINLEMEVIDGNVLSEFLNNLK